MMRKLLLGVLLLVVVGAVVMISAKPRILPSCPIDQPLMSEENCSCPAGFHLRWECTQPDLEHWQCVILKKELFYCTR